MPNPLPSSPRAADSELIHAAADGDAARVERALAGNANPRATDPQGATALIWAARHGRVDCLTLLLPVSFVPKIDKYGLSALIWAAHKGHAECVRLLLPHSRPDAHRPGENNALICAAKAGHLECARLLSPVSNQKLQGQYGRPALHAAANEGHADLVSLLLPFGDALAVDERGWNALMCAAAYLPGAPNHPGQPARCLRQILPLIPVERLLDEDSKKHTAFELSLLYGNGDCADILAPLMPRETVDKAYEDPHFRRGMPGWGARLEAERLRAELGLSEPLSPRGSAGTADSSSKPKIEKNAPVDGGSPKASRARRV